MKAIFLSCNQALLDEVFAEMKKLGIRGYTSWEEVQGCGTATGEPHLGDYVWPTLNAAFISIIEDAQLQPLLSAVKALDEANPQLGLRAFWWEVGGTM